MNGQEWTVPTPPKPGMNENPVQKVLDEQEKSGTVALVSFAGYSDIGIFGVFKSALNVTRKKLFQNLGIHCVILNKAILEYLVQDVRVALAKEGKEEPRVSTGDILTAWLWKASSFSIFFFLPRTDVRTSHRLFTQTKMIISPSTVPT